ncbi:hypothetical protein F5Y16DRAFT_364987 [Xylariaceae sp. FL0255]|nr:hypothetical protein F5Y16DRAFT_364987 [Xylariaceae sp. FL0255]
MTRTVTRLLAKTTSKLPSRSYQSIRTFSQTCRRQDDEQPQQPPSPPSQPEQPKRNSLLDLLGTPSQPPHRLGGARPPPVPTASSMRSSPFPGRSSSASSDITGRSLTQDVLSKVTNTPLKSKSNPEQEAEEAERLSWGPLHEPFHYHVLATSNNTHITVTKPNRKAIVSMSTGNIGFKKAKRGTYDAAYQLSAHVLDKLNQGGWHRKIKSLEVILSGFGHGREAATKVLLGSEGRLLRPYIEKVSDGTKLKFGGTRSKKPRRV